MDKSKKGVVLTVVVIIIVGSFFSLHELFVRHFQNKVCVVCHEMKDPIRRWKESGTAKHHNNCASCHYEAGIRGWWNMNISAVKFFFIHFRRDPNEPIKPTEEPLFIDPDKEPGYWSRVPNHRCFKCKQVRNINNIETHTEFAQPKIHSKLLKKITNKPCIDCHNHEMRKGQKFYEKLTKEE